MDSMIYYSAPDVAGILARIAPRLSGNFVFTLAPRTTGLMVMWNLGRLFPRSDRSPTMIPHSTSGIADAIRVAGVPGRVTEIKRVRSGFYISTALVFQGRST
jgi:magnesium-protoporphyrin O-methyltransferase